MKAAWLLFTCSLCIPAQENWQRLMVLPWMQGRFAEAEVNFARVAREGMVPDVIESFLSVQVDYEIERARYGAAAELLEQAKRSRTPDSAPGQLVEKRLARLYWSVGQFSQAEKTALRGNRWKGGDVQKLDLRSEMDLMTLGEVYLAKGHYEQAIQIFEKAAARARKNWETDSSEWIRAQDDIALANLSLGQVQAASQTATQALSEAERKWGQGSLPHLDALDILGLVRVYESKFMEADKLLSQSLKMREALYGAEHPKVAASYRHAAILHAVQKDHAEAARLMSRSLQIEKSLSVGGPNGRWALALLDGAGLLAKIGQIDDAKGFYESALPVLERELGLGAPRLQDARKRYADLGPK